MKLAGKLIGLFIVTVVAVTAVSSHFASKQPQINMKKLHQEIAKSISAMRYEAAFETAILSGDHLYFERIVHQVAPNAMQVRWVWLEQNVTGRFRPKIDDQTDRIIGHSQATSLTVTEPQGQHSLVTYCPFQSDGRHGAVEITSPLDPVFEQSRRTWQFALWTIAATGLLGIAAALTAGVRWIAKPLKQLTDKMRRVGEGDFASDLEIRSGDELGQLADAVNDMCQHLRNQQETIRQKTEQRIRTLEQLRHADRLKTVGQLAAGLAHEVGTPLNVISGRASMIMDDPEFPAQRTRDNAETIKREAQRISAIIQKLLDFARRTPVTRSRADLKQVIRHAAELIGPLARTRDVRIESALPDEPAMARFDFNQMQQVLMNLIDNAVDASPQGGTVRVILTAGEQGGWAIAISDEGPGIEADDQTRVFEPFFTTKDVGSGTGLGLSIAHGIVQEHGGEISFASRQRHGTTFTVQLPAG
jgi:signal transduction histidine kinase